MLISVHRSNLFYPSFFVFALRCLKLVITWVTMLLIGALVSCACLSFVFVVHSSFRVCIACTVCAAERDYRARLLHTTTVLFHTQSCQQGLSGQASEAPFVSSQSSSETEDFTGQCRVRTRCSHVSSEVGCGIPIIFCGKRGVHTARLGRNRTLGGQIRVLAASGECGSVTRTRLGQQFLQSLLWLWKCARRASNLFGSM